MLALLLAVVVALGSPQPSPSPSPSASPGPLKEIIRIRSSALCNEFATHVNSAIGSAVRNDTSLGNLIDTLRLRQTSDDLMDMGLRREHAVNKLVAYADAVTKEWKDGEQEVSRLRDLAQKAVDPDEKAELKASADALGGALWRQRKVARDLDGFIAYLYAEEMRRGDHGEWHINDSTEDTISNSPGEDHIRAVMARENGALPGMWSSLPGDYYAPNDQVLSFRAARDFEDRLPEIQRDEGTAAIQLLKANDNC